MKSKPITPYARLLARTKELVRAVKYPHRCAPVAEIDKLRSELSAAKDAVFAAIPAMREYARKNPMYRISASLPEQDPNGVHAWLAINDKQKPYA